MYVQKAFTIDNYIEALKRDELERTHYGFILLNAALQAKALNIPAISAIEFGVAHGDGLVCWEGHANVIEAVTGVRIDLIGFDNGEGLPDPHQDYRDVPYAWQKGMFKMDVDAVKKKLQRSALVIGDVRDTVPALLRDPNIAPVGAISFDLDYYTSTIAALEIFSLPDQHSLPRVFCYFDDLFGNNPFQAFNEHVGPLLAIREFNERQPKRQLTAMPYLRYMRLNPEIWNEKIYVFHAFEHSQYNTFIPHSIYKSLTGKFV